jgi:hypothetical protein
VPAADHDVIDIDDETRRPLSQGRCSVAIEAVQLGPAEFVLAAEQLRVGDEFAIDDADTGVPYAWVVIGEPVELAPGVLLAAVRVTAGPEFEAHLRVGRRISD